MRLFFLKLYLIAACLLTSASLAAADDAALASALRACAGDTSLKTRLACFDQIANAPVTRDHLADKPAATVTPEPPTADEVVPPRRPDLATGLTSCASIADVKPRLQCFDGIAGAPRARAAVDPGRTSRNEETGLFEFRAQLMRIDQNANGDAVFTLDDGQVWQQANRETTGLSAGDFVVITTNGSTFNMRTAGSSTAPTIAVRRIR